MVDNACTCSTEPRPLHCSRAATPSALQQSSHAFSKDPGIQDARDTIYIYKYTRGMQSIVGRAELAIAVQPHRRAAELSGLLHIVLPRAYRAAEGGERACNFKC